MYFECVGAVLAGVSADAPPQLDVLVCCEQVRPALRQVRPQSAQQAATEHHRRTAHAKVLSRRQKELADLPEEARSRLSQIHGLARIQLRQERRQLTTAKEDVVVRPNEPVEVVQMAMHPGEHAEGLVLWGIAVRYASQPHHLESTATACIHLRLRLYRAARTRDEDHSRARTERGRPGLLHCERASAEEALCCHHANQNPRSC